MFKNQKFQENLGRFLFGFGQDWDFREFFPALDNNFYINLYFVVLQYLLMDNARETKFDMLSVGNKHVNQSLSNNLRVMLGRPNF